MKRIVTLLLIAAFVTGLAGCASDPSGEPPAASEDFPSTSGDNDPSVDSSTPVDESWAGSITDIAEPNLNMLTLKDLVERDGENLTWADFASYYREDISSGIYIFRYPIDKDYYLLIGGESMEELPLYIRLVSEVDTDHYIDVRTDSIDNFINGG